MNILHIDSSMLDSGSITRDLSAAVVARLQARHPAGQVVRRDLARDEIRHLNAAIAAGFRPTGVSDFTDAIRQEHRVSEALAAELLTSDVIVIGAPMYNFSVPGQLKAWLDRLAQPGRTFSYTANGPVGLVTGKRVIIVSARGGFYTGSALAHMDFQESYLKAFFGFLGITDVRIIRAEGASREAPVRETGIERARAEIAGAVDETDESPAAAGHL